MTDFKPGDRVQYNAKDVYARRPHNDLGTVTGVNGDGVEIRWDNGDNRCNASSYLVPVTDFKPGDRVTVRLGFHTYNDYETGYVREVREGSDDHPRQLVLENGHWGYVKNAVHAPLFTEPSPFAPNPRPLVGPAPTPPATPRYVAPFRAAGTLVYDATDRIVLEANFILRETADVTEFATYVATALNASVFTED